MKTRREAMTAAAAGIGASVLAPDSLASPALAIPFSDVTQLPKHMATPGDPFLPLYREWLSARIDWCRIADLPGNENSDWPESKSAHVREFKAAEAMVKTMPVTMQGFAALAHVVFDYTVDVYPVEEDQLELTEKLILTIWRAASGQTGLPPTDRME